MSRDIFTDERLRQTNLADPANWRLPPFNDLARGVPYDSGGVTALESFARAVKVAKTPDEVDAMVRQLTGVHGISDDEAEVREAVEAELARAYAAPTFLNDLYQVEVRTHFGPDAAQAPIPFLVHLSVKRRDKGTLHDWRHLQEIKSRIIGPEFEAVELYPAELRVVDTANQYHLWCSYTRGGFGFGFPDGLRDDSADPGAVGHRQRGFGA